MAEGSTKAQNASSRPQSITSSGPRITDPRFANIQSDPRYRLPGKKNKVKLDKRFARVLQDDDFVKRAKVDRYGRPLDSNVERKRLKRKYEFDDDEQESGEADDGDVVQTELKRVEKQTRDPLREGRETDSESDSPNETSTDTDSAEEHETGTFEEELNVGPTQQGDVPTGDVTSRVAIVNLDWDNIRAADLVAVFSSFLPSNGGTLQSVAIYPSEFGKERLEREEMEGPPKDIFINDAREDDENDDVSDEEEEDEDLKASILKNEDGDEDFNPTALRKYQLERLRYFYAVLTFSSPSVAKHIYDAVDGTEYLRTANFFDLRFVPDDTDFSSDVPREECERIPDDYKPNEFVTDALQHSKVKLTWDADDTGRKEAAARAFKGGKAKGAKARQEMEDENDLRAYLASDNSDEEDEDEGVAGGETAPVLSKKEAERQRMRTLLGLPLESPKSTSKAKKDKAPIGDMQITFTSGLNPTKEGAKKSVFENSPEPEETTLEKYVRKERERKQRRRDKHRTGRGVDDVADAGGPEVAQQPVETEEENEAEGGDQGFNDPFFANPSTTGKSAPSNKLRKEERLKKRRQREAEEEKGRKQRAELELLMVDDGDHNAGGHGVSGGEDGKRVKHFDMREIERAEKEARKKGKKRNKKDKKSKHAAIQAEQDAGEDDFKVNTDDPRFTRLFDSHEYAIDPTNPRFKGTKGMKALLEEGRKRKRQNPQVADRDGKQDSEKARPEKTSDVESLVEKIKRRH